MDKPSWQERAFEGRQLRLTAVSEESEMRTRIGTRWAVFARVEVLSGLFKGAVYDKVPIYSPLLRARLLELGSVSGRLQKGAALEGAPAQWTVT